MLFPNFFTNKIILGYLGVIQELYVLDLKTKVYCRKKEPNTFSHEQGTHSAKRVLIVWPKISKTPQKFQSNLSAQAQKFWIFEKKLSLGVRSPCCKQ